MRLKTPVGCTLWLFCLLASPGGAQTHFTVTDLGAFGVDSRGNSFSTANDLNNRGQAVGYSRLYDAGHTLQGNAAFLYSNGQMTNLGNFGANKLGLASSVAESLNNRGQVVGFSNVYDALGNPLGQAAFLYSKGQLTPIGNFGSDAKGNTFSTALGINDHGQIIGSSFAYDAGHTFKGNAAFLYSNGQLTPIGNFGTDTSGVSQSSAAAINNQGQIVGSSNVYNSAGVFQGAAGFFYNNGRLTQIGNFGTDKLGRGLSNAVGINGLGQVVGYSNVYDASHNAQGYAAFLYDHGQMTNLGSLGVDHNGMSFSQANAINRAEWIVGFSNTYDSNHLFLSQDAFFYNKGKMLDLNNLITPNSGWTLEDAIGVNNRGQIVGYGLIGGQTHAFLLTSTQAVPEASALLCYGVLLLIGGLVMGRRRSLVR